MRKYWYVFSFYWQDGLQKRASFFMERFRSLVVLISFYYFWSTLLANRESFAGYNQSEMITYVLGMNILRSLVFAGRTDEIAYEINRGELSAFLLKPVSFIGYTFSRDLSEKSINLVSAIIEVAVLSKILGVALAWPEHLSTWVLFILSLVGAVIMNFFLSFIFGCWGFWTAESGGPRFFLELILEFSAGAFFPLNVLPAKVQAVLKCFPSPYLVFFPLNLFLEKISTPHMLIGLATQLIWTVILAGITRLVWIKGLRVYAAQGS
jgi:ABC-2 type transport system permease protein